MKKLLLSLVCAALWLGAAAQSQNDESTARQYIHGSMQKWTKALNLSPAQASRMEEAIYASDMRWENTDPTVDIEKASTEETMRFNNELKDILTYNQYMKYEEMQQANRKW